MATNFQDGHHSASSSRVGPKKIVKSADLNDLGVLLYVLKATEIISCSFVAIWHAISL